MTVDVVLLAGGFGTRMRPLTYTTPKPLLPVLNEPLLVRVLRTFRPIANRALLTTFTLREEMRTWADGWNRGGGQPPVTMVEERQPLGTAGAVRNCATMIEDGRCAVVNADILCDLDVTRLASFHEGAVKRGALATIALVEVPDPSAFGVAVLEGEKIVRFVEKPPRNEAPSRLINAGVYLFEREVLDTIPKEGPSSLERDVFPHLAKTGKLAGFPFTGYWSDLGKPSSYLAAHADLLRLEHKPGVVGVGTLAAEGSRIERTVVGARCRVERDAAVLDSVVYDDCRVGPCSAVLNSILGRGVVVGEGALVDNSVVADRVEIPPKSVVKDQRLGLRPGDTYL